MLQVKTLTEQKEEVLERLKVKNFKNLDLVDEVIRLDEERKNIQNQNDQLLAESNELARQIGQLMKSGEKAAADDLKTKTLILKERVKELAQKLSDTERALQEKLVALPNLPHASVPHGIGADQNEVVLSAGHVPNLHAKALPHWELAVKLDVLDFELGTKITGAGFPVYKGKGAKYQRALIQFFLDQAIESGYMEIQPPILVNEASAFGTGQLPDKEGQMYFVAQDGLYLIPTAEVPLTNIYRDVILKEEDLPIKNCAYTPCFRREAGSYGSDVRGLNRLHQFDKVELVQIVHPSESYQVLEQMSLHVQSLLQKLGLPYRLLRLCGGDISFASALTYDLEVFSAAQQKWLEVSSVSNFESFQSNRLKLRFKGKEGKPQLAHTLNGSALALPRILATLLENYQDEEGVIVPDVLVPYTGFSRI